MWYYQKNNLPTGPIDISGVNALIQNNLIARTTKVWREGMTDWLPAVETELGAAFPVDIPPPVGSPPIHSAPPLSYPAHKPQLSADAKSLNSWFLTYWICLAAGIPLLVIYIGVLGLIAAVVFYFLLIHKLWSLIPANVAKTTPGKAVGFCFIPFFNLYWNFVAFYGLAKALNAETVRYSIPNKQISEGMSLTFCILFCCGIIPGVNFLTSIASIVIGIICLKQMKDAGIALIEKPNSQ